MEFLQQMGIDALHTAFGVLKLFILFFVLSIFLREPAEKLSTGKNFALVHPRKPYLHKDFFLEIGFLFLNTVVLAFAIVFLTDAMAQYGLKPFFPHQPFAEGLSTLPLWLQAVLGLLIVETASFFPHWFMHKFLWHYHQIHHSAKEVHWTTAGRLHPIEILLDKAFGVVLLFFLGFPGEAIAYAAAIHNLYNAFAHANVQIDYPKPLCYLLTSPNYHRWHHAIEREAYDKNFAPMFPFFDLIFGSYYYPQGKLPTAYGINIPEGTEAYPEGLMKQFIYPFRQTAKKFSGKKPSSFTAPPGGK